MGCVNRTEVLNDLSKVLALRQGMARRMAAELSILRKENGGGKSVDQKTVAIIYFLMVLAVIIERIIGG